MSPVGHNMGIGDHNSMQLPVAPRGLGKFWTTETSDSHVPGGPAWLSQIDMGYYLKVFHLKDLADVTWPDTYFMSFHLKDLVKFDQT
jgi:hypothetical protein